MAKTARILFLCAIVSIAFGGGMAAIRQHSDNGNPASADAQRVQKRGVPVMTATASKSSVPVIIRGLGTATAYDTVAVKSRIVGNVVGINFREGQEVKTGDVLVQLDVRPYQAALDQANANLAKDQAHLSNARADLARFSNLLKRSFATEQQVATQKATVAEDEASINGDKAGIDAAKLNVEYATIRSPIDGITGIKHVDFGNLVQANTETLVIVTQIKPIYVVFPIPETDIPRVREAMGRGKLTVLAYDAADQKQIAKGHLDLVDNQVDQTTGTVRLKGEFPNADEALWPGQFVNAHLVLETVKNGVTVPSAAVQTGPNGSFVYVVKPDNTVEPRPIAVTQTENNLSLVASGLKLGEMVVTIGQSRLAPGATVVVSNNTQGVASAAEPAPSGGVAAQ